MKRKLLPFIGALFLLIPLLLSACTPKVDENSDTDSALQSSEKLTSELSNFDVNFIWDPLDAIMITLEDNQIAVQGQGVSVNDHTITIFQSGTYVVSGQLSEGQIHVAVAKTQKVHLVLNGVTISNSTTAPLYVESADKVVVTLEEHTVNTFTDTSRQPEYDDLSNNINACIYSREDITFNGKGTLEIHSYNNGIGCKNDVRFVGGIYQINAEKNGIKGRDSVYIARGDFTIFARKDGILTTNTTDPGRGYVLITDGTVLITAQDDGIQVATDITISGGSVTLNASHEKINCFGKRSLAKGTVS